MDILTGGNLSSILLVWSVRSTRRGGGRGWSNRVDSGIVVEASCDHYYIRVHENLMQYPSNNISIFSSVKKYAALIVVKTDTQSYELTNILTDKMNYTVALLLK